MQNDPLQATLTSYDPRNPLDMTMRVTADSVAFAARELPSFHCITVNAYDLRETGLNAVQEVAFTLAMANAYVQEAIRRGRGTLAVDDFGHRMLVVSNANNDLFEEVAKFRAMRRLWAEMMRAAGAREDRTCALTLAVHTAGTTLTKEQPVNNVVRGTVQALAAILGGCQGLDLSCYDEATSLPSELAASVALRTQQILAWESGVTRTADPLGGSYYVESLTEEIATRAESLLDEIAEQGGMVAAVENGWAESQIRTSLVKLRDGIADGEIPVVGVNYFTEGEGLDDALPVTPTHLERSEEQAQAVTAWKRDRDQSATRAALERLVSLVRDRDANVMPGVYDAGVAGATVGEVIGTIRRGYELRYDPFGLVEHPFGI
jgi:methylmalonyl-CoA mutase N-terminal domain/subunit